MLLTAGTELHLDSVRRGRFSLFFLVGSCFVLYMCGRAVNPGSAHTWPSALLMT